MAAILTGDEEIRRALLAAHAIAVVGASAKPERPSHGVMVSLQRAGFRIRPVNPGLAGQSLLGETVAASLADMSGPIDIVDVFRRAEDTPDVARQAVAAGAKLLWLQLGIVNHHSAEIALAGGLDVVMDRCSAIEARRLLRPR